MDDHVEDEPHNAGIREEEAILKSELISKSGYDVQSSDNVRRMILEALVEKEEVKLRRLIDSRWEKVVPLLFQDVLFHAKNVHTPSLKVMVQKVASAFFTGDADEVLDEKVHIIAESRTLKNLAITLLIVRPSQCR